MLTELSPFYLFFFSVRAYFGTDPLSCSRHTIRRRLNATPHARTHPHGPFTSMFSLHPAVLILERIPAGMVCTISKS